MDKKPLTHKKCVKSDMLWLKLLGAALALSPISIVFGVSSFEDLFSAEMLFPIIFGGCFVLLGIFIFISSIKTRMKMVAKQYYVYVDMVIGKNIDSDDDSTTYYLCFANNKYKKAVSIKKFQQTQVGAPYYLVQPIGNKHALSAFDTNEWYIDESVHPQLRQF